MVEKEIKKMNNTLIKLAGTLDIPKDNLAPDVFDLPSKKLHPHIKKQILEKAIGLFEGARVEAIFIIGSITGYKWEWDTDIDINIAIKDFEPSVGKTKMTKEINGTLAKGTKHPLNFFVSEFHENTLKYFRKAD